ncbi:hypothetical protein T09_4001 [Trichinella sp. T9]|nr:hypothetical protein T09_4001 [Trichinella sp. T9]
MKTITEALSLFRLKAIYLIVQSMIMYGINPNSVGMLLLHFILESADKRANKCIQLLNYLYCFKKYCLINLIILSRSRTLKINVRILQAETTQ